MLNANTGSVLMSEGQDIAMHHVIRSAMTTRPARNLVLARSVQAALAEIGRQANMNRLIDNAVMSHNMRGVT